MKFIQKSQIQLKVLHIISGDLWAGAEVQAYLLLRKMNEICDVHVVVLNDGELANKLREHNIGITVLDERKYSSLEIFLLLRALIKDKRPTLVHTHRQKENILGAIANFSTIRARCVRTQHGSPEFNGGVKVTLLRWFDTVIAQWLQHAIIAVSDELGEKLAISYSHKKVRTIRNGVDIQALQDSASVAEFKSGQPQLKHIGFVGRLVSVKRVDIFIEMAGILCRESDNYCFHIIGSGPLMSELTQKVKSLKLDEKVIFHGHRSDTASCIKSLDSVIMCSDHEGMPMTALETLALGTRLIAHKVGGLRTLEPMPGVVLIDKNQPEEYCLAIKKARVVTEVGQSESALNDMISVETTVRDTMKLYKNISKEQ